MILKLNPPPSRRLFKEYSEPPPVLPHGYKGRHARGCAWPRLPLSCPSTYPGSNTSAATTPMTPFTRSVYAVVSAIPSGSVASYGMVAAILGRPRAPRAVGGALSGIPDELDLPWWRVISSSGRISTSSIHHTAQIQRALLEEEGVRFTATGRIDWDRYEWNPSVGDLERINA